MTPHGKVLVVDDDPDIREALGMALRSEGYAPVGATDGADALAQLHAGPAPALILLDLMMPRMDGEQLAHALHDEAQLASIPVVVISGDAKAADAATRIGAQGCLAKPVELDDLLAVVERFTRDAH